MRRVSLLSLSVVAAALCCRHQGCAGLPEADGLPQTTSSEVANDALIKSLRDKLEKVTKENAASEAELFDLKTQVAETQTARKAQEWQEAWNGFRQASIVCTLTISSHHPLFTLAAVSRSRDRSVQHAVGVCWLAR